MVWLLSILTVLACGLQLELIVVSLSGVMINSFPSPSFLVGCGVGLVLIYRSWTESKETGLWDTNGTILVSGFVAIILSFMIASTLLSVYASRFVSVIWLVLEILIAVPIARNNDKNIIAANNYSQHYRKIEQ